MIYRDFTSEESIFEGESVEDSEALTCAQCETTLVLVEAHTVDSLSCFVRSCPNNKGRWIDYCRHSSQNIINYFPLIVHVNY